MQKIFTEENKLVQIPIMLYRKNALHAKMVENKFWECFLVESGNNEVLVGNDYYLIADQKNS